MALVITISGISPDTWCKEISPESKVLGRVDSADIQLEHDSISREHCRFWEDAGTCYVEDRGSLNGTYFEGRRIEKRELSEGDRLLVGPFELVICSKDQIERTHDFELPAGDPLESDTALAVPEGGSTTNTFKDLAAEERHLVSLVHRRLTPSRRLGVPGMLIETAYVPSGMLGGDCFDCFKSNQRWVFAVFEPMNHGSKAALTIMLLRAELNRWITLGTDPGRCLKRINDDLVSFGVSDLYICGCLAVWNPLTRGLVYSTAGQHPPLLLRQGQILNLSATAGGYPLGVEKGEEFEEIMLELSPKDRVFFFTDGVGGFVSAGHGTQTSLSILAGELLSRQKETLQVQVQQILERRPEGIADDALLVGCEVVA